MKKIIGFILIATLMFSLIGCSGNKDVDSSMDENPLANKSFPSFETKDLEGNKVTKDIFRIYETYKDKNVNMIGIVSDVSLENSTDEANNIVSQTEVTYTNLICDKNLSDIANKFPYVPVTLFVDSNGKILETFIPGRASYTNLSNIIDSILNGDN